MSLYTCLFCKQGVKMIRRVSSMWRWEGERMRRRRAESLAGPRVKLKSSEVARDGHKKKYLHDSQLHLCRINT